MGFWSEKMQEVRVQVPSGGQCYVLDRRSRMVLVVGLVVAAVLIFAVGLMIGRQTVVAAVEEPAGGPGRDSLRWPEPVGEASSPSSVVPAEVAAEIVTPVVEPIGEPVAAGAAPPGRRRASVASVRGSAVAPESVAAVLAAGGFELGFRDSDLPPRTPYGRQIYNAARRHAMNPELLAAMIRVESAFDRWAVSSKGARGLMQVMPGTAARFGVDGDRLFEPSYNLSAGAAYLSWLNQRFAGDLELVLAAYNSGEAAVERYDGVPPYRETRQYVVRVAESLARSAAAEGR